MQSRLGTELKKIIADFRHRALRRHSERLAPFLRASERLMAIARFNFYTVTRPFWQ
jgi:hypothetical protein